MPSLINLTQNTDPLDHTTVAIELTVREVAHLTRLMGCTSPEISSALGMYQESDVRPQNLYGFLLQICEEVPVDIDDFEGGHLGFINHDDEHQHHLEVE